MAGTYPGDAMYRSEAQRARGGDGRSAADALEGRHARSVPSLIGELLRELRALARNEAQLARTEVGESLHRAQSGAGGLGVAAVLSLAGLVVLLQAATLGLDLWLQEPWLSALIVGGVTLLIGLSLAAWGRSRLKAENLSPRRTAESLQRDADLIRRERPGRSTGIGYDPEEVR